MNGRRLAVAPALLAGALLACTGSIEALPDGAAPDASGEDAGRPGDRPRADRGFDLAPDAAPADAEPPDGGGDDAGDDAGAPDAPPDDPPPAPDAPPPPDAPACPPRGRVATTPAEVFSRAGVFVASPAATFPAGAFAATMRTARVSWVALQVIDGTTPLDEPAWRCWIDGWRDEVRWVGAWGVNRTSPVEEAARTAEKLVEYGFDFYIADAEEEYKYSQSSGYCPDCLARSGRWIAEFRSRLPDLPAALSSYGRVDLADLDWRAWVDAGFHFLPQAYWNEHDIYRPRDCVDQAVNWVRPVVDTVPFWSADLVHPTLGLWGGGVRRYVTGREYVDDLRGTRAAFGNVGFSIFRGDMCPPGEWAEIGAAVGEGLAEP